MPCYFPLQAKYSLRPDGKKDIVFCAERAKWFSMGISLPSNSISLPCGRCMGCRLEKSRQWALRCVHESKLYDDNCFVTLTYDPEHLPKDGSLNKKHMQDFIKRVRRRFDDRAIRVFYCGEYGDRLGRPHYHIIFFNLDFSDKEKAFKSAGFWNYTSSVLSDLWTFGSCSVTEFSFETAAYVARYCTKKVNGKLADAHYQGRLPEFAQASLKPGIGKGWLDKFGGSDVFPHDVCIVRGVKCKPPRYYDVLRDREDPVGFAKAKEARRLLGESKADDGSFDRLATRLKCQEARFRLLIRSLEK